MIHRRWLDFWIHYQRFWQQSIVTRRLLLILGVFLLVLWGCGVSGTSIASRTNDMSVVTLTQPDNGKSIKIRVGDRVVLNLRENPTTGFQWTIAQNNHEVLKLQSSEYTSPSGTGVGGGGQRTFIFKGQTIGTAEPHFNLQREWQGDQVAVDRFAVTVQVQD